eukprot:597687-Prorocentrum_minimum.AAC.3
MRQPGRPMRWLMRTPRWMGGGWTVERITPPSIARLRGSTTAMTTWRGDMRDSPCLAKVNGGDFVTFDVYARSVISASTQHVLEM